MGTQLTFLREVTEKYYKGDTRLLDFVLPTLRGVLKRDPGISNTELELDGYAAYVIASSVYFDSQSDEYSDAPITLFDLLGDHLKENSKELYNSIKTNTAQKYKGMYLDHKIRMVVMERMKNLLD